MSDKGLTELYDEGNWGSENKKLRGVPILFLGPELGANLLECHYLPTLFRTFNLFWDPSIIWEICVETNRYAAFVSPRWECKGQLEMDESDRNRVVGMAWNPHPDGNQTLTCN